MPTTMTATADAATSRRRLNQFRARSRGAASWRIFLTTFRAKNGESVGLGTRPRTSHNCLSSSGSMVSTKLNCLQHRKLRSNGRCRFTLYSWRFKETLKLPNTSRMPHFTQRLCFDLPNAFARNLELPAYLLQRSAVAVDQPRSLLEHLPLPIGERLQHVLDLFLQQYNGSHVARVFGASVLNKVAKICFFALPDRGLERDWLLRHLQDRPNTIHWQKHFFGHFVGRRFSPVFLHQLFLHPHELVDRLDHMHGNSDRARLVGNGARDGLANPPSRVSGKFVSSTVFKFLDRFHQPHIAFLDQIQKRKAAIGVFFCDGNNETKIGLDHFRFGLERLAQPTL